ncbi:MAG: pyrroline-5-carboxylate reductase family protein, partial [Pirellulaceae bacterium]
MTERLGFLGGGQMALALATGAVESGMYLPQQMVFCEPALKQQQKLREAFPGCEVVDTADSLLGNCHRIILAVKPQVLRE